MQKGLINGPIEVLLGWEVSSNIYFLVASVMVLTDCPILPRVNSSLYKICALLKVFYPVMGLLYYQFPARYLIK